MNFANQESNIQIITNILTNLCKNKLLINTILLFWVGSVLFGAFFVFYIKIIKQRSLVGNDKDVKGGNIPFLNIDKLKDAITI